MSEDPIEQQYEKRLQEHEDQFGDGDNLWMHVRADDLAAECAALRRLCRDIVGQFSSIKNALDPSKTRIFRRLKNAAEGKEVGDGE